MSGPAPQNTNLRPLDKPHPFRDGCGTAQRRHRALVYRNGTMVKKMITDRDRKRWRHNRKYHKLAVGVFLVGSLTVLSAATAKLWGVYRAASRLDISIGGVWEFFVRDIDPAEVYGGYEILLARWTAEAILYGGCFVVFTTMFVLYLMSMRAQCRFWNHIETLEQRLASIQSGSTTSVEKRTQ